MGPIFYRTGKALGLDVDFRRCCKNLDGADKLFRADYYTTISEEFVSYNAFLKFLDYYGFPVRIRRTQHRQGSETRKKIGVNFVIDAMEIAPYVNKIYCCGPQRKSMQVHIVSSGVAKRGFRA